MSNHRTGKNIEVQPEVSVLMTVYNGMPYVQEAVQHVLDQTYTHIQLVIVDDHSTDGSWDYLTGVAQKEANRILLRRNISKGRGSALNYGLTLCTGEFVAINDSDDFSLPTRISKQVQFMRNNPDYGLIGTFSSLIDLETREIRNNSQDRPITNQDIRKYFLFGQPIQHVTAMFRKSVLNQLNGYNEELKFLFDRDIFLRAATLTQLYNLPENLVLVGEHKQRYFQYTYVDKERMRLSQYYKYKAVDLLSLPSYYKPLIVLEYWWSFIPESVRNFLKRIIGR